MFDIPKKKLKSRESLPHAKVHRGNAAGRGYQTHFLKDSLNYRVTWINLSLNTVNL